MTLAVLAISVAACDIPDSDGMESGPEVSTTIASTTSSLADSTTSSSADAGVTGTAGLYVAGAVRSPEEAFCSGLAVTITEFDDHPFDEVDFERCLEDGLFEDLGLEETETDYPWLFSLGCGLAVATDLTEGSEDPLLADEEVLQVGILGCESQHFDPETWLPQDYAITTDGVCYFGVDNEVLTGCRDEAGNLITTTTPSFVSGNRAEYISAISGSAPQALRLSTDEDLALAYGQNLCSELTDWGGYEYAKWIVDVENNGVGHEEIPDDQWTDVRDFLVQLPRIVTTHLCAGESAAWEESYDFRHEVFLIPDDTAFGGTVGEALFYSENERLNDIWQEVPDNKWNTIGLAMCSNLDAGATLDSQRLEAADLIANLVRSEGKELSNQDIQFLEDSITNAALVGYCPRHDPWRWANLDGNFDPLAVD